MFFQLAFRGISFCMATTQDVGLLTRKLAAADYDPSRYVSEISQRCVGGEEVLPFYLLYRIIIPFFLIGACTEKSYTGSQ